MEIGTGLQVLNKQWCYIAPYGITVLLVHKQGFRTLVNGLQAFANIKIGDTNLQPTLIMMFLSMAVFHTQAMYSGTVLTLHSESIFNISLMPSHTSDGGPSGN